MKREHKPIKIPTKYQEEPFLSCYLNGVLKGNGIALCENYQSLGPEEAAERIKAKQLYHDRELTVGMIMNRKTLVKGVMK